MPRLRSLVFLLVLGCLGPAPLLGWGEKGHAIASEAATHAVPSELPSFFHAAYGELVYLGYDPDRWRGAGPSADEVNAPDHFLDWEYVAHLELPKRRYDFLDLLHESGTLRRFGIRSDTSGFVVWRIAELSEYLAEQWRLWRRAADPFERATVEQNIVALAGILGHYVADAANPHHATIHYNGWVGDPARGFRNDCEAHARFESVFVTNHVALADVVPRLRPPRRIEDPFAAAVALVRESNLAVERLYELDARGVFDYRFPSDPSVDRGSARAFAAERLAIGASTLRDLWWSAWLASAERPRR